MVESMSNNEAIQSSKFHRLPTSTLESDERETLLCDAAEKTYGVVIVDVEK